MISIIIPTLNEEHYIGRLLLDLSQQTFQEFETIIVDAHSDDNTVKVAKQFGKQLRLKVSNSKIRNVSHQRNIGAKNAKHDLLVFLDADTSIEKDVLWNVLRLIRTKKLTLAGGFIKLDGKGFFYSLMTKLNSFFLYAGQYTYPTINGAFMVVKKSFYKKVGGCDETVTLGEDQDFVDRAKRQHGIKVKLLPITIKASVRRFEMQGKWSSLWQYTKIITYVLLFGPIKKNIFHYPFGQYENKKSNHK